MSDQKNWDAALIKTWRLAGDYMDALKLFTALSGKQTDECDPPLKRVPKGYFPYGAGIRVFVAEHLPKISDRLWSQTPDKDILLLRKLETSPYDTLEGRLCDPNIKMLAGRVYRDKKRMSMEATAKSNRNRDTDWNVMKGLKPKRAR